MFMLIIDLFENSNYILDEYNVIGSAVRLDEIPPEYRKLKFLGRGATTIAFQKDPETAVIFTRDNIKVDWLYHGLHMVKNNRVITPVKKHHISGMQNFDLEMVEMPMLYPLSPENRKKVLKELKYWENALKTADTNARLTIDNGRRLDRHKMIADLAAHYEEENPDSVITPLLQWIMNYDPEQYTLDLGLRQFKQTADGKIVLLDPVVSRELINMFYGTY